MHCDNPLCASYSLSRLATGVTHPDFAPEIQMLGGRVREAAFVQEGLMLGLALATQHPEWAGLALAHADAHHGLTGVMVQSRATMLTTLVTTHPITAVTSEARR